MALFLSKFENKVDKKGRISVPAPFRAELAGETFSGVIVRPSFVVEALEGCGRDWLVAQQRDIRNFAPFSEERASFAQAIFAQSHQLPWDSEGRVLLPEELLRHAGIGERALFVGLGDNFQIWEPDRYARVEAEAIAQARQDRGKFGVVMNGSGGMPS